MKNRKFDNIDEAIAYLESKGTLKFHGRIGHDFKICLYTYLYKGREYRLNVHDSGLVEVRED